MRPINIPATQAMKDVINTRNANTTMEVNVENSAMRRQVEVTVDEDQRPNADGPTDIQPNMTRPATNRRVEQPSVIQCNCHYQQSEGVRNTTFLPTENQRLNVHTEYEDRTNGASKFFHGKRQTDENGLRECQIIRILPDESNDYMNIVRESVSAQTRSEPKPMFVNNYFVGDNNWRSVPRGNTDSI